MLKNLSGLSECHLPRGEGPYGGVDSVSCCHGGEQGFWENCPNGKRSGLCRGQSLPQGLSSVTEERTRPQARQQMVELRSRSPPSANAGGKQVCFAGRRLPTLGLPRGFRVTVHRLGFKSPGFSQGWVQFLRRPNIVTGQAPRKIIKLELFRRVSIFGIRRETSPRAPECCEAEKSSCSWTRVSVLHSGLCSPRAPHVQGFLHTQ